MRRNAAILFLGALAAVTWGALVPGLSPPPRFGFDKLVHIQGFGVLGLLLCLTTGGRRQRMAGGFALMVFAIVLELVQSFCPGRVVSLRDVAASMVGIMAGMVSGWWICRRLNTRP